jgi:tetratricopeptide (TPR) repeat protein
VISRSLACLVVVAALVSSCGYRAQVYVERAKRFYDQGKYEDSALNARKALQSDSRSGDAYYWLGLSEIKRNNPPGAYEALVRAVDLLPQQDDPKIKLAELVLQFYLHDAKRPAQFYNRITQLSNQLLSKNPNSYDALILKSYLAITDSHFDDAIGFLRHAELSKPNQPATSLLLSQALIKNNEFAEGERVAKDFIAKQKAYGPLYDALYVLYRSTNRMVDAEFILRSKIDANPSQPQYVLQLAMHFATLGKRDEMKAALNRILAQPKTIGNGAIVVGDFYLRLGDYDEALKLYASAEASNPASRVASSKRIAAILAVRQEPEKAITILDEVVKERPEDDNARALRAQLLAASRQSENVDKGISEIQALLTKNDTDPLLHYHLARGLQKKGDLLAAAAHFETAAKLQPNYRPALLALLEISEIRRDFQGTIGYADRLLAINPNDRVARVERSSGLIGLNRDSEANIELTRLLRELPEDRNAQLQLAILQARAGKYAEAEAVFRKYYNPGLPDLRPLTGLMEILLARNEYDRAIRLLTEDLPKSAKPTEVRALIGLTAIRARRYNVAIEAYEQCVNDNPSSPDLYIALGEAYQLNHQLPRAIESFQKAANLAPKDSRPMVYLGNALQASGRNAEALNCYSRLARLSHDDPIVLNNLAFLMMEAGDKNEALKLIEQARQKSPKDPAILDTLGSIYVKKEMATRALPIFDWLVKTYPGDPAYHYHFGLALIETGDKARARKELESALLENPQPDVVEHISELLKKL